MTGNEFLDRVKAYARRRRVSFEFDPTSGKGSHGRLYLGNRHTTVKDLKKEISSSLLSKMCRELGISRRDLYDS
jgi:mRNA interferase HicA